MPERRQHLENVLTRFRETVDQRVELLCKQRTRQSNELKAERICRALREKFPGSEIDQAAIVEMLAAGTSIERVQKKFEQRLSAGALTRIWYLLRGFWQ